MESKCTQIIWRNTPKSRARRKAKSKARILANGAGMATKPEVSFMLKICPRTIERRIQAGTFPPGLKFGRYVRWRVAELEVWLAAGCPEQWEGYFKPKSKDDCRPVNPAGRLVFKYYGAG